MIYSHQDMEATKMSIERWIDKEDVVYVRQSFSLRSSSRRYDTWTPDLWGHCGGGSGLEVG